MTPTDVLNAGEQTHPGWQRRVYAENQPQYMPLPTLVGVSCYGQPTASRWRPTWRERLRLLIGGDVWVTQLTFGGALQPLLVGTEPPDGAIVPAALESAMEW